MEEERLLQQHAAYVASLAAVDFRSLRTFDQKTAPLGLTVEQLKARRFKCRVRREGGEHMAIALTGYSPPWEALFPVEAGAYVGLRRKDLVFHSLDQRVATAYTLDCSRSWDDFGHTAYAMALKSTGEIFAVAKTVDVNAADRAAAFDIVAGALKEQCTGTMGSVHEATSASLERKMPVRATYCDQGSVRIVISNGSAPIAPELNCEVAYVDRLLWDKYLKASREAIKAENEAQAKSLKKAL
ncbi:hypothetical protein [Anaeromyxobacter paludicola]|uniref:hypothetical protein n=1 Tax=Anaeromyxobacter paludicola TaxID=2918171 RepID=UPI0020C0B71C|nr:hypothetical protein [Anaeromyxobacter paludicola]